MTQMTKGANIPLAASALRATLLWSGGPGVPDVDTSALLLESDGQVSADADFVYYNQPQHPSGSVRHLGKSSAGQTTDVMEIDLGQVPTQFERVVLAASADGGTFGQVPDLALLIADRVSGGELARFAMTASAETAFVGGELYRHSGGWKFRAVGQGYSSGLAGLAADYGIAVDDTPAGTHVAQQPPLVAPPTPEPVGPPVVVPPMPEVVAPPVVAPPMPEPVAPPVVVAPPMPEPVAAPPVPEPVTAPPVFTPPAVPEPQPAPIYAAPPAPPTPAYSAPPPPTYAPPPAPAQQAAPPPPPPPPVAQPPAPQYSPVPPAPVPASAGYPVQPPPAGPPPAAPSTTGGISLRRNEPPVALVKPDGTALTRLVVAAGWRPTPGLNNVDLDASVIAFDAEGAKLEIVWHRNANEFMGALQHTGDSKTGVAEGDAEAILVDLARLPDQVAALVFTINSFTGQRFTDIASAYFRLVDHLTGQELVRFDLSDSQPSTAVLMAIVRRRGPLHWDVRAIGEFHDTRFVKKLVGPAARHVTMS
jgi:stress response protein SCP2